MAFGEVFQLVGDPIQLAGRDFPEAGYPLARVMDLGAARRLICEDDVRIPSERPASVYEQESDRFQGLGRLEVEPRFLTPFPRERVFGSLAIMHLSGRKAIDARRVHALCHEKYLAAGARNDHGHILDARRGLLTDKLIADFKLDFHIIS